MSTIVASGTLTATGSAQTLGAAQSSAGTYIAVVDTTNMAAGDAILLTVSRFALASDSSVILTYEAVFQNAQADPLKVSVPLPCPASCSFTAQLTQTAGVNRAYKYSIEAL